MDHVMVALSALALEIEKDQHSVARYSLLLLSLGNPLQLAVRAWALPPHAAQVYRVPPGS